MRKAIYISFSVLVLIAGILILSNSSLVDKILFFIENILGKSLNVTFWKTGIWRSGVEMIVLSVFICLSIFYRKYPTYILAIPSISCILLFFIYVEKDALNIPFNDDFDYLQFLNRYYDTRVFTEIFTQEGNESRLIFMKFFSVLLFHLNGFNFRTFLFFSNACLLGTCILLFRSIKLEGTVRLLLTLVLCVLIFQFEYYDSTIWASGALYSECTIFFVILSIYFMYAGMQTRLVFSLLAAILAVLNCGGGFLAFLIGLGVSVIRKRRMESIAWIVTLAILCLLYFHNHSFPRANYTETSLTLTAIFHHILRCFAFSCVFLGSSFQFYYKVFLPILGGIFVWLVFIFLTVKKYYHKNPIVYFFLSFLILISFLPALFRSNFSMGDALGIRYGIYSIFALSCSVVGLAENVGQPHLKKLLPILLTFSIFFHLLTNIFF